MGIMVSEEAKQGAFVFAAVAGGQVDVTISALGKSVTGHYGSNSPWDILSVDSLNQSVTFSMTIKNTGSIPLTDVNISYGGDFGPGKNPRLENIPTLSPGQTIERSWTENVSAGPCPGIPAPSDSCVVWEGACVQANEVMNGVCAWLFPWLKGQPLPTPKPGPGGGSGKVPWIPILLIAGGAGAIYFFSKYELGAL